MRQLGHAQVGNGGEIFHSPEAPGGPLGLLEQAVHGLDIGAWFKKDLFWVTQAREILPPKQWNFNDPGVVPGGLRPPTAQARCG